MCFDLSFDYVMVIEFFVNTTYILYILMSVCMLSKYKICSICELHVFVSPWLWRRITSGIWGNPPDQRPEKIQSGDAVRLQQLLITDGLYFL